MRATILLLMALCGVILIGCGGDSRHDVVTGENGTLAGLVISPTPQKLEIRQSTDFYLDWEPGTEPPSQFKVEMESIDKDGTLTGQSSDLKTISTGHYRLEPDYLDGQTFYLLTVSGNGEEVRAIYLTGGSSTSNNMPHTPSPDSQVRHTVTTP